MVQRVVPSFQVETALTSYPIVVERGVLNRLGSYLPSDSGKVFIATTDSVWDFYGKQASSSLDGRNCQPLIFQEGEAYKRLAALEEQAEHMVLAGADRSTVIVALGGGIVGDMAGFLASVFMRGIPVVQVPTTLLAQVDASIGGKTAVNLKSGKNLLGSFHQPLSVLIDPGVLDSLPGREFRAGLYEVIKYGVIASPELFRLLETRVDAILERKAGVIDWCIGESVRIKSQVVSADERERGERRILNFGHTAGHALEAETAYARFLHGEAVAFGMRAASLLAADLDMISRSDLDSILNVIAAYGPIPPLTGVSAEALAGRLGSDKKTVAGQVHFVLPTGIGRVEVRGGLEPERVLAAIEAALS